jgi:hypothetical protein
MTKLEWDKVSERLYETGLDHGVLYLPSSPGLYDDGVVWNGLVSVAENFSDETAQPYYFDGVKYLDAGDSGEFSATLQAYTYPEEFLSFEGVDEAAEGFYYDDQSSKVFGLTYRTTIGAETDREYQIHLLYNLTATESVTNYQNGSNLSQPILFSWGLYSVGEVAVDVRPTAHIILDSRYAAPKLLKTLEDILYGTDNFYESSLDGGDPWTSGPAVIDGGSPTVSDSGVIDGNIRESLQGTRPRLPSLQELLSLVLGWSPKIINPDSFGGLASLVSGQGDLTSSNIDGIYSALPKTRLTKSEFDGLYILVLSRTGGSP